MSTPNAQPAINTLFQILEGSPATYQTVANVGDLTGESMSSTIVDVTSHSTGTPWREKRTTLLDAGDVTFPLFWVPGDAGMKALLAHFTNRDVLDCQLVYTDAAETSDQFVAQISKWSKKAPVAGVYTADVTFTITGEPTLDGSRQT